MTEALSPPDLQQKFVRVTERRRDGLVAFNVAIADPALFVELLLPADAFEAFCRDNRVRFLDGDAAAVGGDDDWNWRLRDATRPGSR